MKVGIGRDDHVTSGVGIVVVVGKPSPRSLRAGSPGAIPFVAARRASTRSNAALSRAELETRQVLSKRTHCRLSSGHVPRARTGDERRDVHLVLDRDEAMIGSDHDRRVGGESGVGHRAAPTANTGRDRRSSAERETGSRRAELMLHVVGHEQTNGRRRRLVALKTYAAACVSARSPAPGRRNRRRTHSMRRWARAPSKPASNPGVTAAGSAPPVAANTSAMLRRWPDRLSSRARKGRRTQASPTNRIEQRRHAHRLAPRQARM